MACPPAGGGPRGREVEKDHTSRFADLRPGSAQPVPFVWPAGSGPCSSWRAPGGVLGCAEAAQCPTPAASILPVEGQGWKADLQAEERGAEISPQGGSQRRSFRSVTLSGPSWLSSQSYPIFQEPERLSQPGVGGVTAAGIWGGQEHHGVSRLITVTRGTRAAVRTAQAKSGKVVGI